jgi:transcriptional regulator with XRE-family HTH domain
MDVLPQDVGKRIRTARERKGWTQSDLARALDRARQHVFMLEQGQQFPGVPLLRQLAQVLEVSTDYLLGLEDEVVTPPARRRRRGAVVR